MSRGELTRAVFVGLVLITLGVVPGLFQGMTDGIHNFRHSLFSRFPMNPPHPVPDCSPRPLWLAGMGLSLIVVTGLAYLSN
jgi:hypothetical protein